MVLWLILNVFLPNAAYSAPLDLKGAVSLALDRSPTINSAQRELEAAELDLSIARAAFLPSLDLDTSHGLRRRYPLSRLEPWASSLSLALTESLYDNGASLTRYASAQLKREQANLSYKLARETLCLGVANEYAHLSLAYQNREQQKSQFQLTKRQYDLVSRQYYQGMKTRKDLIRLKTQLSRAEIDVAISENAFHKNTLTLRELMIRSIDSGGSDQLEFVPSLPAPADLEIPTETPARQSLLPLRIAEIRKENGDFDLSLIERKRWPEVNVTAGVTYSNSDYVGLGQPFYASDQLEWNALLQIRFNLWDWGIRRHQAAAAVERKIIAENEIDKSLITLLGDIDRLMLDLKQLEAQYRQVRELLALEEKNYAVLDNEYRLGKVAYVDLVGGLRDLSDAKSRYYSAGSDLKQALYAYRFHQGGLCEKILKP